MESDSEDGRVLMDQHGGGSWAPFQVAPSLAEYLGVWARWFPVWRRFGGDLRDDDCVLRPEVRTAIEREVLGPLPDEDRRNWLRFVG